jgi:cytochrome d ubiquinol oxidase subunit II
MDLRTIWFLLVGVLLIGYAVLDGFDLGVGILHRFAKDDTERRMHLNAIGPIWDGNEVWLLTGGGALFAAFPPVYATAFSGFYIAFMLLVAVLILRATSFEFRGKVGSTRWRGFWDWCFTIGSAVPALLYGVAVGNVLRGLPIDAAGEFTGGFLGLLNPYALLVGLVTITLFTMHGAAYLTLKVTGDHRERMRRWVDRGLVAFLLLYTLATGYTMFGVRYLFDGLARNPLLWIFLVLLIAAVTAVRIGRRRAKDALAFLGTSGIVVAVTILAAVAMYPRLLPSRTDLAYSLTIYNASSSPRTLWVMLVIALLGMPFVVGYTIYVYRVFRGTVVLSDESY